MCGICGIIYPEPKPVPTDLLQRMTRTLRHRGPDQEGFIHHPGAGLGFQRLAIIDLTSGAQPMSNEGDRYWITFNGEIYNYQELRQELESTGRHQFKTRSDTEVILHLYEDLGERCVEKLRGMFAFAIWDTRDRTLFMARDRLGKKPLVYAALPHVFLFASELKALLEHPELRRDISPESVDLYLSYQYIPSPHTIFKTVHKLPPAHTLTWKNGHIVTRRYWAPAFLPKTTLSFHDAKLEMMRVLKEATRLRMIADVPLGAFLSGGKDSSVIVGLMSELSTQPVKTFSIGFEDEDYSELRYAKQVAERFKTEHHEFIVKPEMTDVLPKMAWHYGDPFADPSALPSYYVAKMTRQHVTVALNGDGGDETLAGYPRYQAMKALTLVPLPSLVRRRIGDLAARWPASDVIHSWRRRMRRLLELAAGDPTQAYPQTVRFFQPAQREALYSREFKEKLALFNSSAYLDALLGQHPEYRGIDPYLNADLQSYLPECLMTKMDIASMATSLETRSPFLDHHFIELTCSFPDSWKLKGLFRSKYILDECVRGWLPDGILNREKQGFSFPMARWMRGPLKDFTRDMLLSPQALQRGIFDAAATRRLVDEHMSQQHDHASRLWALLMLELWFRAYLP